jgi:hypothetical protein
VSFHDATSPFFISGHWGSDFSAAAEWRVAPVELDPRIMSAKRPADRK